jgi:ribosome-associated heat shock protein Hsp15
VDRQRIDKWLWHARIVKTRTGAAELVASGHVRVNSVRALAPSHPVKVGDVLTIALDHRIRLWKVADFAERRGDATAARKLYVELQE